MSLNYERERAYFEEFMRLQGFELERCNHNPNEYVYAEVQVAWQTWLCRAKLGFF